MIRSTLGLSLGWETKFSWLFQFPDELVVFGGTARISSFPKATGKTKKKNPLIFFWGGPLLTAGVRRIKKSACVSCEILETPNQFYHQMSNLAAIKGSLFVAGVRGGLRLPLRISTYLHLNDVDVGRIIGWGTVTIDANMLYNQRIRFGLMMWWSFMVRK